MRSMGRMRMRSASICAASADLMPVEDSGAEVRTVAAMMVIPTLICDGARLIEIAVFGILPADAISASTGSPRRSNLHYTARSSCYYTTYWTTRCVNGETYAMRNTRIPTRHANAMLWKKT